MSFRLACVTGATSGIGRELCTLLAKKGIDLVVSGRNKEVLQQLEESLSSTVSVLSVPADLALPSGRELLIEAFRRDPPDLVINNAGFALYGNVLDFSLCEQTAIFEVNAKAVLELTVEAARAMISTGKKGVILNVSSAAAFQVSPSMSVYAAAKAFVNQFSQAFDYEVKDKGVRVLAICPGMTATDFQRRAGGTAGQEGRGMIPASFVAEEVWKQVVRLQPLRIVDWRYRIASWFSRLLPNSLTAVLVKRIIDARIKEISKK